MPAWATIPEKKMTGIDPEQLERRRRWAAAQLGLEPGATPEEARAVWLRLLPEEEFVPSSEARWALVSLLYRKPEGNWEARADEAAAVQEEERLRGEVETFAEAFWDLPLNQRSQRWQELEDRCSFAPALRERLRLLEAGLKDLPLPRVEEEGRWVAELAAHARSLFLLRPQPRARARQTLLRHMQEKRKEWQEAALRLRQLYPAVAALDNDLMDRLRGSMPGAGSMPARPPQRREAEAESPFPRRFLWILLWIAVGMFRAMSCNNKPSTPPHTAPARYPRQTLPSRNTHVTPPVAERLFNPQTNARAARAEEKSKKNRREENEGRGGSGRNNKGKKDRINP